MEKMETIGSLGKSNLNPFMYRVEKLKKKKKKAA